MKKWPQAAKLISVSAGTALALFASLFAWSSNVDLVPRSAESESVTPRQVPVRAPGDPSCTPSAGYPTPPDCTVTPSPPPPSGSPSSVPPGSIPPGSAPPSPTTPAPGNTVTTTPSGDRAPRTISIEVGRNRQRVGLDVGVKGRVISPRITCFATVLVTIRTRTVGGGGGFSDARILPSLPDGTYYTRFPVIRGVTYVATVAQTPFCEAATSDARTVLARADIDGIIDDHLVRPGQEITISVRLTPCVNPPGTVQLRGTTNDGKTQNMGSKKLNRRCRTTFTVTMRRSTVFQVLWSSPGSGVEPSKTKLKRVRVRR